MMTQYVLLMSCNDRPGIVHEVSGALFKIGCNIEDSAQFSEGSTSMFYIRVHFSSAKTMELKEMREYRPAMRKDTNVLLRLHHLKTRCRTMILVSKFGHCLNDLMFRQRSGLLDLDVAAVVSNHTDFAELAAAYKVPFHHLPVSAANRSQQEQSILDLAAKTRTDLVVLATCRS